MIIMKKLIYVGKLNNNLEKTFACIELTASMDSFPDIFFELEYLKPDVIVNFNELNNNITRDQMNGLLRLWFAANVKQIPMFQFIGQNVDNRLINDGMELNVIFFSNGEEIMNIIQSVVFDNGKEI